MQGFTKRIAKVYSNPAALLATAGVGLGAGAMAYQMSQKGDLKQQLSQLPTEELRKLVFGERITDEDSRKADIAGEIIQERGEMQLPMEKSPQDYWPEDMKQRILGNGRRFEPITDASRNLVLGGYLEPGA